MFYPAGASSMGSLSGECRMPGELVGFYNLDSSEERERT